MHSLPAVRRCWWAVAALAIACYTPTRAEAAGCSGHAPGFYSLIETDAAADPAGPVGEPAPKPCQGPNCSRAPLRDGLPPAPAASPQFKEQVRCFAFDADSPPASFDREAHSERPVKRTTSIFHPPRAG